MEYFLKTERLGFTYWNDEFLHYAIDLWGDPQVSRFVVAEGVFSEADIKERLLLEIKNKRLYGIQYYPVFLLEGDIFVGCCGLRPYDTRKSVCEFGFYFKPEYWGKGFAQEAGMKVIEYALDTLNISNIYAGHNSNNKASERALKKLGFEYIEDTFYEPTGLYHPLYMLKQKKIFDKEL